MRVVKAMKGKGNILGKIGLVILIAISAYSCRDEKIEPEFFGSISGQVLNSETNQAIENVSITTNPSSDALITDANGNFDITNVRTGTYTVVARKEGFGTESVSISVSKDETTNVSILMKEDESGIDLSLPYDPSPGNESSEWPNEVTLTWRPPVISGENDLKYTVLLYEEGSVLKNEIATETSDTSVQAVSVDYETTYLWQVNTTLESGSVVFGEVWSFRTTNLPENRFLFASLKDGNYEIYSSDSSGNDEIRLTNSFNRDWNPLWSPTKDVIAFTSNQTKTYIYTVKPNGTDRKQISNLSVEGYHNSGYGICWSPGGGYIVFPHYDNLYRVDKNGLNLTWIAQAPTDRHFRQSDWTAQGNKIVVETVSSTVYKSEIYIMNSNGTGMQKLVGDWPGNIASPTFSIDGQRILFTHDVSGFESPDGRQLNAHIYSMNINDTNDIIDISANKPAGTNDLQPRFSPDGAKVIFINQSNDNSGNKEIWTMNLDGSGRERLFENAEMPDWQ